MKNSIRTAEGNNKSAFAVAGHVGVGHVHSHSGFVQDDSSGFIVVAEMMREATGANTRITRVTGEASGKITVETADGGVGTSFARRGLTPFEIELLARAIGEDAIYNQRLAVKTFGRMYGQGAMEPPVALQGAAALAALDTLRHAASQHVTVTHEPYPELIDKMAAMRVEFAGHTVSLLLVINGSVGGVGPAEDNEGNTAYGPKAVLMRQFEIDKLPTVIVESKAFNPAKADIPEPTYLVRAQKGVDNTALAIALTEAAKAKNLPCLFLDDALPAVENALTAATRQFADRLGELAKKLHDADGVLEKVSLTAEIAKLVSEDAGGVTFMSNTIHKEVRSAGIVPGNAAVLSMIVPKCYAEEVKIPLLSEKEAADYRKIIENTLRNQSERKQ